jgi:hypothetical protein
MHRLARQRALVYPEVLPALTALRGRYRLSVLSDAYRGETSLKGFDEPVRRLYEVRWEE